MGNCLGRSNLMVKPLESDVESTMKRGGCSFDGGSSPMRIKVRMTKRQLEELKAQADTRMGNSELGRLIVKECLEGNLSPHAVEVGQGHLRRLSLTTIDEEAAIGNIEC